MSRPRCRLALLARLSFAAAAVSGGLALAAAGASPAGAAARGGAARVAASAEPASPSAAPDSRPNILFALADDWGWPHAGAYGDRVVKTPTFDRLAREGALFHHCYISSPSCTPSRGAALTGQYHWRLEAGANLWSIFPDRFETYPERLARAGYAVGHRGKAWGPGRPATRGRQLVGPGYRSFAQFLDRRPEGKPFCFWLGSGDPHRPYAKGSGARSGMDLSKVHLFGCFPDVPGVRGDVADYYFEVQRFDALVGAAVAELEKRGELDRTIVLMSGDHGMPFPRGKSNLYDSGTRVPLAVRWPQRVKAGRVLEDFVSFTDFAPTFCELAGVDPLPGTTGRSLLPILSARGSGRIDPTRDRVFFGKERHVPGQEGDDAGGYPCRAIRTGDFLYIRNFRPDRWPAGTPHSERAHIPGAWLADCDNGPTKLWMDANRDRDETTRRLWKLSFGKRPAEELYDLGKDPEQLTNMAADPAYRKVKEELSARLLDELLSTADPRVIGTGDFFDRQPYLGGAPRRPKAR